MSPSGLHVNKPVVIIIIGLITGGIVWFKFSGSLTPGPVLSMEAEASPTIEIPESKTLVNVDVKHVKDLKVQVEGKDVTVAYRETKAENSILDVLFLHGQAFKSQTWVSEPVWTLQMLYTFGYRAVAIDLPGYGDSPQATVEPSAFLESVISTLKLDKPVIVSPSMSGGFSLPYLFKDPANVLTRSRGFVAVAPVMTSKYSAEQYGKLEIPTLIIYGEKDTSIGAQALKDLTNLPKKEIVELTGAKHACYLDKPLEFHKHFISFLKSLKP